MNGLESIVGQVAGVVFILGFLPYIFSIVKGDTKPNRTTWIIWTAIGTVSLVQDYAVGSRSSIWVSAGAVLGPFVIAILSLKYGSKEKDSTEKYYFMGSLAALILWYFTGSPLMGLALNIFIDFCGAMPTILKTWKDPESEDFSSWVMFLTGNLINLFAVRELIALSSIYPIYLYTLSFGMVFIIVRKYRSRSQIEDKIKQPT